MQNDWLTSQGDMLFINLINLNNYFICVMVNSRLVPIMLFMPWKLVCMLRQLGLHFTRFKINYYKSYDEQQMSEIGHKWPLISQGTRQSEFSKDQG